MHTYDPTINQGTATYYARGRPPYARALAVMLVAEVGLDSTRRMLDVGCGPGILTVELADHVEQVIGLDPDAEMLAEGTRRAAAAGAANIAWIRAWRGPPSAWPRHLQARNVRPVVPLDGLRARGRGGLRSA